MQDDNVDPNEIYPWFHGDISKEAAVEELAKSKLVLWMHNDLLFTLICVHV